MAKKRLDLLVVELGLAQSRELARALIMEGAVLVNGQRRDKIGQLVEAGATVELVPKPPFVSRGGLKLDHVLACWGIPVAGLVALDVGASTGGFTDCLLQRGAAQVYALDVGRGQLDYGLRQDSRVVVMEKVNARYPFDLPEKVDLATVDVSFISLKKILPNVALHLKRQKLIIALVKPQFEADRADVGRGGVIRDATVHARVLGDMVLWAIERGYRLRGLLPSPILGNKGNREFFLLLEPLLQ